MTSPRKDSQCPAFCLDYPPRSGCAGGQILGVDQSQAGDDSLRAAAKDGVCGVVICPTLIYGQSHGAHRDSIQVPKLIELARKSGVARHVGRGANIWSNVHIDDLVDLYLLAIEQAPAGSFFYAENGEASMKELAQAIALDDAIQEWGGVAAAFTFGSNSRVRGVQARSVLGWQLHRPGLLEDVEHRSYPAAA